MLETMNNNPIEDISRPDDRSLIGFCSTVIVCFCIDSIFLFKIGSQVAQASLKRTM